MISAYLAYVRHRVAELLTDLAELVHPERVRLVTLHDRPA